jgi:hypothetical protein
MMMDLGSSKLGESSELPLPKLFRGNKETTSERGVKRGET